MSQLYGLLDYQNTLANKELAAQSQKSTAEMKHMTHEMKHIARQTKTETVSMKIITVVTLFFLPGTFISVCLFIFFSPVSYESIPHMKRDIAKFGSTVMFRLQHSPENEDSWTDPVIYRFH